MVHDFDWLRWTLGEPERVFAKGLMYRDIESIDYMLATFRFVSGAIAHVEGSWAYPGNFHVMVEIAGDKGLLDFDNEAAVSVKWLTQDQPRRLQLSGTPALRSAHELEVQHFVDVIAEGVEPRVSPYDALMAVRMARAVLQSIETGRPVLCGTGVSPVREGRA
jgi:predicted dehydrogenase